MPDANIDYNNQVIAFLKQKAISETPKPRIPYMNPKDMQVGVMNPIQYEKGIFLVFSFYFYSIL